MKTVIDKASSRGHSQYNWLNSYHTFSFDNYYNPARMGFGALRVLNDDWVAPGEGFGTHPHKNMEIVSIPLKGHLKHGDSTKNERVITVGDIQVMSAGTGIFHSEKNSSASDPVEFLQIWIMPKQESTKPLYQDFNISALKKKNELALIVSPDGSTDAKLLQDTWFSIGEIEAGKTVSYKLHQPNNGVYAFIIEGKIELDNILLSRRDGVGISETDTIELQTLEETHLLFIEVPM
jgi:hypothetical protein